MDNEIVVQPSQTPAELIQIAIAGGADLDKLEKLMVLQERWEANEARKAYHKAMSAFKENPPKIDKDRHVGYATKQGGKVGYSHASLANVTEKITAELSKHGLSASWKVKQNGAISVTCVITHIKGHSEEVTLTANADATGSKNDIQAIGSTISYLQRYSILCATGLATFDQDNDGKGMEDEKLDENKLTIIKGLMAGVDEAKFLAYMNVEKIEDISKTDYLKAKTALEAKKAGAK